MRLSALLALLIVSFGAVAQEPAAQPAATGTEAPKPEKLDIKELQAQAEQQAAEYDSNLKKLIEPIQYERAEHPRDPFRLPEVALEPLTPGPIFGPFMEMHEVNLDQVKVQGIILNPTSSKAIISYKPDNPPDAKDKTVVVKVGDPLGENFGRVQSIRDGKIVILQTLDENGTLSTTTRVLSVRKYNLKPQ